MIGAYMGQLAHLGRYAALCVEGIRCRGHLEMIKKYAHLNADLMTDHPRERSHVFAHRK